MAALDWASDVHRRMNAVLFVSLNCEVFGGWARWRGVEYHGHSDGMAKTFSARYPQFELRTKSDTAVTQPVLRSYVECIEKPEK